MGRPLRVLVFVQLDLEYGRGLLRGVARYFRPHRDVTVLKFIKPERYTRDAILRLRPDGVIAQVWGRDNERVLAGLGLPVVNVSGMLRHSLLPTVNSDDVEVGRVALRHLHSRNLRNFAYVGDRHHAASRLRWSGFAEGAQRLGLTPARHFLPHNETDAPYPAALKSRLRTWVKKLPAPVGVFCFTDRVALEVADACTKVGRKVPDDLAILGTDNDVARLEFSPVAISSVQLDTLRIGELAAQMLHDAMGPRRQSATEILVPPLRVSIRTSTEKLAVDDALVAHAEEYIRLHAGSALYVEDIARQVGVSRRTLEMRFRAALGTSIYEQVQRCRFERVLEMMSDPAMSLDAIAFSMGFGSPSTFSTMFRRHFGAAPSIYRQRLASRPAEA